MKSVSDTAKHLLWRVYGHVYDGLLDFYPYQLLVRQVADRIPDSSGALLDVGCGTGNLIAQARNKLPTAHLAGVDGSKSMLAMAKKKFTNDASITLTHSDILAYLRNQPDEQYDVITSVNVIYALGNRDEVWRQLLRIMRPGGKLIIATSVATGSGGIIREHIDHAGFLSLLKPRLMGVFVIDSLINLLGGTGQFEFPDERQLRNEITRCGGCMSDTVRTYGGPERGVDILFEVTRS